MMKALYLVVLTANLGLSALAHADCAYPKAPEKIPDGTSASEAEMIDAMKAFKAYDADVNAYIACLDAETKEKSADGNTGTIIQMKSLQAKKQKAAVDELTDKATKFNAQVRAFKSKKG